VTVTGAPDATAFSALVGVENSREATVDDAVQGVHPQLVLEPADEAEVSAVLAEASRQRLAVVTRGGGTKLSWGAPPSRCDIVLSTLRLDRLVEHQPGDLICIAEAGISLAALQDRLAAAPGRQRLMLDPPQLGGATLGGIVATAASGSLRTRYGTPRDLIIGVRFVLADGTVGHAGGKVVKNVAGYDMGRLLCGSLGTLAVITQLAFKLHPAPPRSRTVVLENASPTALSAFVNRLRSLAAAPSAVDVVWPEGLASVRIEGAGPGVDQQAASVVEQAGCRVLDDAEAEHLAATLAPRPWQDAGVIAGIAIPRTHLARLLEAASDFAADVIVGAFVGSAEARLPEDEGAISGLRAAVDDMGGHMALRRAPAELAHLVWPDARGVDVELMRSLKRSLDPAAILSPGRFLGGI
jgi:glycolate oxidase FAD binding subunit